MNHPQTRQARVNKSCSEISFKGELFLLLRGDMTHNEAGLRARKSDECRGMLLQQPFSCRGENTNNIKKPHSKIINSLFGPVSIRPCLYSWMRQEGKKPSKYCFRVQLGKRVSSTFPLPVKNRCFLPLLNWKSWFFLPWCSPDALLSLCGTMTTLEHPAGAPQLGIPRIVVDIFGFHQSKWLQFSIKMLNLVLEPSGQGSKYEAVSLDDKWPSFDWANREKRGTGVRTVAKTHGLCVRSRTGPNRAETLGCETNCIFPKAYSEMVSGADLAQIRPRHHMGWWPLGSCWPDLGHM